MRIEITLRDAKPNGKRIPHRACVVESCRVFKQAGDGLRLDNVAPMAYKWFLGAALAFVNDDPSAGNKNGTLPTEERLSQYK